MTTLTDVHAETAAVQHRDLWIGGREVASSSSARIDAINPTSRRVWATLADATPADAEAAVIAAQGAFRGPWSTTPSLRFDAMLKLADLLGEQAEQLALLDVQDNGKLLRECVGQIRGVTRWYRFYAGLVDKIQGATMSSSTGSATNYTIREPLGVIACITAWNSPLLLAAVKLAPALAAGNTAVLKPSEYASNSTLAFARLCSEAGMPAGVVNVITGGAEAASALVQHPGVAHVSFTGSPGIGAIVASSVGAKLKDVTLELGGKSPNILFEDAALDAAVPAVLGGIFAAAGQSCVAGSRLLVHRPVYEDVLERLRQRADAMVVGDPLEADTEMGPISNAPQLAKVEHYVGIALEDGARLITGGARPDDVALGEGLFYLPTIFADVAPDSRLAQQEVFGPVLAVIPFEDEDEAVAIANATEYGLAAGVWTSNLGRAQRMIKRLECGTVFVNTYRAMAPDMPVGGYKSSGIGRENGIDAVLDFTQVKSVWIEAAPPTDDPFRMRI